MKEVNCKNYDYIMDYKGLIKYDTSIVGESCLQEILTSIDPSHRYSYMKAMDYSGMHSVETMESVSLSVNYWLGNSWESFGCLTA